MSKVCAGCCNELTAAQRMKCGKCDNAYHYICVNIPEPRKLTDSAKKDWICPVCQSKLPKKGNSNTPVRSTAQTDSTTSSVISNVTLRVQKSKVSSPLVTQEVSEEPETLTSLVNEIKLMRQHMSKMSEHLQTLSISFTKCNERLDECEGRYTALAKRTRVLEDREIENQELREKVIQLEEQLNTQAQSRLSNEMEIVGVNECPNESKIHIVLTAAMTMGVTLTDADIDQVTRAGPKGSISSGEGNLPRPLVVKFVRRAKRNEFLKAAKSRRNLTTTTIGVDGPSRKLYFNERLTKANRQLFREARMQSNNAGFKYCWTRNGTILMRKKTGSPEIIVKSRADLAQCLESSTDVPILDEQPPLAPAYLEDREQETFQ